MATRSARLDEFITSASPILGTLVEILCEDHVGTYLLPYLCECTAEGFRNERTRELIQARVVGWRNPSLSKRPICSAKLTLLRPSRDNPDGMNNSRDVSEDGQKDIDPE